jgi:hypothetical protein
LEKNDFRCFEKFSLFKVADPLLHIFVNCIFVEL